MTGKEAMSLQYVVENMISRANQAEATAASCGESDPMGQNYNEGTGNGLRLAADILRRTLETLNK